MLYCMYLICLCYAYFVFPASQLLFVSFVYIINYTYNIFQAAPLPQLELSLFVYKSIMFIVTIIVVRQHSGYGARLALAVLEL